MDLNHHRRYLVHSENMPPSNLLLGKTTMIKPSLTGLNKGLVSRRPALGDIHNKLPTTRDNNFKKPPVLSKTNSLTTTTHTTTAVTKTKTVKLATTTTHQPKETRTTKLQQLHKSGTLTREESIQLDEKKLQKIEKLTVSSSSNNDVKSYSSQRIDFVEEIEGTDPQFVPEYINDIFEYLRSLEVKYPLDSLFLSCHKTTPRMRYVLINWLVDVHMNFRMLPETFHLCVSIVDRYLQKNKTVGRDNLQLVGIAALFLAAKYEEMYLPDLGDFEYVCDNSFSTDQIKRMERSIMRCLDFSFGRPLSIHFLRRYSKVAKISPQAHALAKYLLELALIEPDLCYVQPSLQAAAASCLAQQVLAENRATSPSEIWTKTMVHYSTYKFNQLEKIIKLMAQAVVKTETSKYQAIRSKYATTSYGKISLCAELKGPVIEKYSQK